MIVRVAVVAVTWAILSVCSVPPRAVAQPVECPAVKKGLIQTCNTAKLRKDEYWDWDLFLVTDEETLKRIDCVEYILHPTFSPPVWKTCQKGNMSERGFVIKRSGWGTFRVKIKITFKDGTPEQYFSHNLIFD